VDKGVAPLFFPLPEWKVKDANPPLFPLPIGVDKGVTPPLFPLPEWKVKDANPPLFPLPKGEDKGEGSIK